MSEAFEKWCAEKPLLGCCAPEDRVACVHDLKAAWNAGMERAEQIALSARYNPRSDWVHTIANAIKRERET